MHPTPLLATLDICVVGGCAAGVAAAVAAARAGLRVMIVAERTYLGDDIGGTFELWAGCRPTDPLAQQIWPDESAPCTPLQVKAALEQAVLDAGVQLMMATGPTHVLRQARDELAGVVIATSGGPLAIAARVILDATPRGLVMRMAGLMPAATGDSATVSIISIGEQPAGAERVGEIVAPVSNGELAQASVWRSSMSIAIPRSVSDWARADVALRDRVFTPGQFRVADLLIDGRMAEDMSGHERLRFVSALHLPPAARLASGTSSGEQAARIASLLPTPSPLWASAFGSKPVTGLRWLPTAMRFDQLPLLNLPGVDELPDLGGWDVLVMGGGTAGSPAAVAASQAGARTLVTEAAPGLGGVGTQGMIASYFDGNVVGFTRMIDRGVATMGPGGNPEARHWNIEWKAAWYLRQLAGMGAEVWFGARGVGCRLVGGRITGAILTTPWGAGAVTSTVAVDASGSATLPAAAGAPTSRIGADHVAVQGTGLSPRTLDGSGPNTDWTFVDDADPTDVTRVYVAARRKWAGKFDVAQMVDSRERRRIVSDLDLSALDILARRTFPDTICTAWSSFDTHGFTIHPVFMVKPPLESHDRYTANIPLRSLLPRDLEGVLVTGLGMGAHRDAMPVVRMQADVQNTGAAAGLCAAWAALRHDGTVRAVPIRALQQKLVKLGNLAPAILTEEDSFPISAEAMAAAIAGNLDDHCQLALIFADHERSQPRLIEALSTVGDPVVRVRIAQVLGLMCRPEASANLRAALSEVDWDAGWNFTGMCQFGRSTSHLDGLLIALGRTGDPRGAPVVASKMAELSGDCAFSHVRAVALAAVSLGQPMLVEPLSRLLGMAGIAGHAQTTLAAAVASVDQDGCSTSDRNLALRELALARALWQLGDHHKLGERTLRSYADDVRGAFAAHARAVLAEPAGQAVRWTATRRMATA